MKKLLVVLAVLALAVSANANLLQNGSFEDGLTGWASWSTEYGNLDWQGTMGFSLNDGFYNPGTSPDGGNWAGSSMSWAAGMGGGYQTIAVANGDYAVSGWLSGGGAGDAGWEIVAWDGAMPADGSGGTVVIANAPSWTQGTQTISVTTGQLTVASRVYVAGPSGDGVGAHIDGLSVEAAPVPEPSSMLALGTGLMGLAGFVIRRRK